MYEARQKYLHDEASMLGGAKLAGIKEVAKNMLDKNMSFDLIIEATGLSMEEIKTLQAKSNDKTH